MTTLKTLQTKNLPAGKTSKPSPEVLVAGDPLYTLWLQDESHEGRIRTGVWEATEGTYRSNKAGKFEFCHILSGRIELTPQGGEPVTYGPGDNFVMKPDFVGTWRTLETVRKIFVVVEPS